MECPSRALSSNPGTEEITSMDRSFETRLRDIRSSVRLNSRVAVAIRVDPQGEGLACGRLHDRCWGEGLPCCGSARIPSGTEAAAHQSYRPDFLRSRIGMEGSRRPGRLGTPGWSCKSPHLIFG